MKSLTCGVVIYDELALLQAFIPNLQAELQNINVEWIFVLNHKSSATRDIVKRWLQTQFTNQVILENPTNNLGQARQLILTTAQNKYIYFTDPDIELIPKSVQLLISSLNNKPEVLGAGGPVLHQSKNVMLQKTFDCCHSLSKLFPFSFQMQAHTTNKSVDHIPTCHLLLHRKKALALGGFSILFAKYGEDLDFSHRACVSGLPFLFYVDAPVYHHQHVTFAQWLKKMFSFGRVQIYTQRFYLKLAFRWYRLLPAGILILGFVFILAFPTLGLCVLALLAFVSLIVRGFIGVLMTALVYAAGELFELALPLFELQNALIPPAAKSNLLVAPVLSKKNIAAKLPEPDAS
ncbi:MAG: glycosyltransferase family 2 protein [Bdellovibrionaceae bacterium]|nr:glycosyltransferase family 2 protein [Bdellovibrio sp.]